VHEVGGLVKLRRSARDPREIVPALKAVEEKALGGGGSR
jgi:hypothetical protein